MNPFPTRVCAWSAFLGAVLVLSASQAGAEEVDLPISKDVTVLINSAGAIKDITAYGVQVIEEPNGGGALAGNPSPHAFADSAMFQAWDWLEGKKVDFDTKHDEVRVAGGLLPKTDQNTDNACRFLISYKKVKDGVLAISIETTYPQEGSWTTPLFYRLHLPVSTLVGAKIDTEGEEGPQSFTLDEANFKSKENGDIKIKAPDWVLDVKAGAKTQLALGDGRAWSEDAVVIDLERKESWQEKYEIKKGQKITLGATLSFSKK